LRDKATAGPRLVVLTRPLAPPPCPARLLLLTTCTRAATPTATAHPFLRARNAKTSTNTRDPIWAGQAATHPWRLGFGSPPSCLVSSSPPPPSPGAGPAAGRPPPPPPPSLLPRFPPLRSAPLVVNSGARSVRAASPARGNGDDRARLGCGGLGRARLGVHRWFRKGLEALVGCVEWVLGSFSWQSFGKSYVMRPT
jgi:hypothetical protein